MEVQGPNGCVHFLRHKLDEISEWEKNRVEMIFLKWTLTEFLLKLV